MLELPHKHQDPAESLCALDYAYLTICTVTNSALKRAKINQALTTFSGTLVETTDVSQVLLLAKTIKPLIVFLGFDFFEDVLLRMPMPPESRFVLMGTSQELERVEWTPFFHASLEVPFLPEQVVYTVHKVMGSNNIYQEELFIAQKKRRLGRTPVTDLEARIIRPMSLRGEVLDISHHSIHVAVCKWPNEMMGCMFHIELNFQGLSIVLDVRLVWARDDLVSFCFQKTRPPTFERFMERVMQATR